MPVAATVGHMTIGINLAVGIGVDLGVCIGVGLGEVGASVLFRGHGQADGKGCH